MTYLATGTPSAKIEGERVLIAIPSGETDIQLSLSLNEAIHLARASQRAAFGQIDSARQQAVIIAFDRAAGGAS